MARACRRHGSMTADTEARRPPRRDRTKRAQGPTARRAWSRSRVDESAALTHRCGASTRGRSRLRRCRAAPVDRAPRQEASSTRSPAAPAIPGHVPHRSCLPRAGAAGARGGRVHAAKRTPLRGRLHTESSSSRPDAPSPRRRAYCNAAQDPQRELLLQRYSGSAPGLTPGPALLWRRYRAGGTSNARLNARLNAASDS